MARHRKPSDAAQHGATPRNNKKNDPALDDLYPCTSNDLTQKQRTAIELLLRGLSDAETAAHLGVDRGTVYRWRTRDEEFIDELTRQRQLLWQQSAQRLQAMFEPALDIVQKHLTSGDPRLAIRAAALLLRVATPARLAKITGDPAGSSPRGHARPSARDADDAEAFADMLEAYINAPLPGEVGRAVDANAKSLPQFGDNDDDEGEDLDDDLDADDDDDTSGG